MEDAEGTGSRRSTEGAAAVARAADQAAERLRTAVARHARRFAPPPSSSSTSSSGRREEQEPNRLFVRQSATELLETFSSVLREVDAVLHQESLDDEELPNNEEQVGQLSGAVSSMDGPMDELMEVVVAELGHGDSRIRSALRGLLSSLASTPLLRVVLEMLHCALPTHPPAEDVGDSPQSRSKQKNKKAKERRSDAGEDLKLPPNNASGELFEQASAQVVETLAGLARRHPPSVPRALDCLGSLSLHESHRSASFQVALDLLPSAVRNASFPSARNSNNDNLGAASAALRSVLQTLLSSVRSKEEALTAWEAVRREWEGLEERDDVERTTSAADTRSPLPECLGSTAGLMLDVATASLLRSSSVGRSRGGGGGGRGGVVGDVLARSFLQPLWDDAREALYDHENLDGKIGGGRVRAPSPPDPQQAEEGVTWENLLVGDWVGLVVLSQVTEYADFVDQVMDAWMVRSNADNSEAALIRPLTVLTRWRVGGGLAGSPRTKDLYQRLVPGLLRFAVFSLLAPARIATARSAQDSIEAFVLSLHEHLDRDPQRELVQCIIQLLDEVASWEVLGNELYRPQQHSSGSSKKRKRSEMTANMASRSADDLRSAQQAVRRLVNSVLASLAASSPNGLIGVKEILFRQLTQSSYLESATAQKVDDETTQDVCRIVARLAASDMCAASLDGLCCSDVVELVRELLLEASSKPAKSPRSASSHWKSPEPMAHRGIQLATELFLSSALAPADEARVQNWVVCVLLPATRRMVDPRLGIFGLNFFKALLSRSTPTSSSCIVFRHLKTLLSNTGLIQLLHHYQNTPRTCQECQDTFLAYRDVPPELTHEHSAADPARDMVICITYFLKRCDRWHPLTWEETTTWVYTLVNMYLRLGRERATKGWKAQGWLVAPIELPALRFPSHTSDALATVETEFSRFDVASELSLTNDLPLDGAALAAVDLDIRKAVDAMVHFALSLWVALGLSAAVLQNSCDDLSKQQNLQLIHFHLLKTQCLRLRLRAVEEFFKRVQSSLARQQTRHARRTGENSDLLWAMSVVEVGVHKFGYMDRLFDQRNLIRFDILLQVFCTDNGGDVRCALTHFATRTVVLECRLSKEFRSMRLKTVLAEQLEAILETTSSADCLACIQPSQFTYCLRLMKFLTGILPRLRKGYFASFREVRIPAEHDQNSTVALVSRRLKTREDGFSMEAILSFACAVSSVLKSIVLNLSLRCKTTPALPDRVSDVYCHLEECPIKCPSKPGQSDASFLRHSSFFVYVKEMLDECDCLPVAASLVNILATLAVTDPARHLSKAVASSWLALNTIYADVETLSSATTPFVVCCLRNQLKSGLPHKKLLFETTFGRLCLKCQVNRTGFSLYRVLIIQHFCLLALSGDLVSRHTGCLASVVQELDDRYHNPLKGTHRGDSKHKPEVQSNMTNRVDASLPFLSVDCFEDFYEYLLFALVGVLAICPPCTIEAAGVVMGPYIHIDALLLLLRRLLALYKEHFVAFSLRSSSILFAGVQQLLAASRHKVDECVTWRNNQPFPQPGGRAAETTYDPGSTLYLRRLLVAVRTVVATVFDVCDAWQHRSDTPGLKSKSIRLQQLAHKTIKSVNCVAAMHNWPPTSSNARTSFDDIVKTPKASYEKTLVMDAILGNEVVIAESASDNASDDDSFCATGNWG